MRRFFSIFSIVLALFVSCDNRPKIYSLMYNDEIEWFQESLIGMKDAAKEFRVDFKSFNSYYDLDSEMQIARQGLNEGVDSFVVCPLDNVKSSEPVNLLRNKKIPIVTWNTVVDSPVRLKIVVDSEMLGSQTGDYIVSYFEENKLNDVKMLLLSNYTYTISEARCNGLKKSIQSLVESEKISSMLEVKCELENETKAAVKHMLKEHSDIKLIWCWNQTTLLAAFDVLKEQNRSDVLLCGTDLSSKLAREMLNSESNLIAVTTQQPYMMGYLAVKYAAKCARGESFEEETLIVPVITYTKKDREELEKYLKTFKIK